MRKAVLATLALLAIALVLTLAIGWRMPPWRRASSAAPTPAAAAPEPTPVQAARNGDTPRGDISIDPHRQQLFGVRTVQVTRGSLEQTLRAVGVVRHDETRQSDINVKVEGWIRDLYVDYTGQPISKGQLLFSLYSPEILTTENEYLLAVKARDRVQQSQIADARLRADQLVASARQRLVLWDVPVEQIRQLEDNHQPHDVTSFRSPVSGYVLEKQALQGLHVMPGQSLYKVADLSVVWVEANVYESDLPLVRNGARAMVTTDAYPAEHITGRVTYVYPSVNEQTRTTKVRFELPNRAGRLKPGMFASVELTSSGGSGLIVPADAVLDSGKEQVVFVAQGDGRFEPRRVRTGRRLGDNVQLVEGLKDGETIATGATFFLDSESQLRAAVQGYESPPSSGAPHATGGERLDISLRIQPDPPKAGENQLEVTVKEASGKPVDDAQVTVQFYMAAMPTMNMPAMRNEVKLSPAGGGLYRGTGQIMMAGRWDSTVTVARGGQRLASTQVAVVAR